KGKDDGRSFAERRLDHRAVREGWLTGDVGARDGEWSGPLEERHRDRVAWHAHADRVGELTELPSEGVVHPLDDQRERTGPEATCEPFGLTRSSADEPGFVGRRGEDRQVQPAGTELRREQSIRGLREVGTARDPVD